LYHLKDANFPIDHLPIDVIVVLYDKHQKANRFRLITSQLEWHRNAHFNTTLDDNVEMIPWVTIVKDYLISAELLESEILAELLVCLLVAILLDIGEKQVFFKQLLCHFDLI